jgi:alpha-L-fucosidase
MATIFGTAAGDTLVGTAESDSIFLLAGNDWTNARAGDDTVDGGAGNDKLNGDAGADLLIGAGGNDTFRGGAGDDTALGGAGRDDLFGDDGNDLLDGGADRDRLYGGLGHNTILGGGGNDEALAGSGDDLVDMGDGDDWAHGNDGNDTMLGGLGTDKLYGDAGNDVMRDDGGRDGCAFGGAGDDSIEAAIEDRRVNADASAAYCGEGGTGDDTLTIDVNAKPEVDPSVLSRPFWAFGATATARVLGDAGTDSIIASADARDTTNIPVSGGRTAAESSAWGGAGDDRIETEASATAGGEAKARAYGNGGDGNDWIHAQATGSANQGGSAEVTLLGGTGDDVLTSDTEARAASSSHFGGLGRVSSLLDGGAGDDHLTHRGIAQGFSAWGATTLLGGEGNDRLAASHQLRGFFGNVLTAQLDGGAGDDVLSLAVDAPSFLVTSPSQATLKGGGGNDVLSVSVAGAKSAISAFKSTLDGGSGNDTLLGGLGTDKLYGDAGNDVIIGEDGNDTIAFVGLRADYLITPYGEGHFTVVDHNPFDGDDGTDNLYRVEFAQFQDTTVQLSDVSRDLRMSWWKDAELGMFLHWGLYSVLGGEWDGQQIPDGSGKPTTSEWILLDGEIPECDYQKVANDFDPVNFDADAWVREATQAGMEYVVVTAKHHDGFSMWDSAVTDYDIKNTAWGERVGHPDPLSELKDAADKYGMKFGLYYSIWDWHNPYYAGPTSLGEKSINHDGCDDWNPQPNKDMYKAFMYDQLSELIARYNPDMLWFDGQWDGDWSYEDGKQLHEKVRELSPDVIVNNRLEDVNNGEGVSRSLIEGTFQIDPARPPIGDHFVLEQSEVLNDIVALNPVSAYWQATITMNDNWGYNKFDKNWKNTDEIGDILQAVSEKGGTLLLNVGPTGEGEFPPQSLAILDGLEQMIA